MFVIDASVWISRLLQDEPGHKDSRDWLTSVVEKMETIVEPTLVLAEVAGALARRAGNASAAHRAVQAIVRSPGISLVPLDRTASLAAAQLAADLRLKGADAVYVALAGMTGCELVTWDRTQLERGGGRVPVRRPSDLLAGKASAE